MICGCRSYKNGYVWHDLCEDDLILPAHGNEYILKGSEFFEESNSGRIISFALLYKILQFVCKGLFNHVSIEVVTLHLIIELHSWRWPELSLS